jgi:hypothetical protein
VQVIGHSGVFQGRSFRDVFATVSCTVKVSQGPTAALLQMSPRLLRKPGSSLQYSPVRPLCSAILSAEIRMTLKLSQAAGSKKGMLHRNLSFWSEHHCPVVLLRIATLSPPGDVYSKRKVSHGPMAARLQMKLPVLASELQ